MDFEGKLLAKLLMDRGAQVVIQGGEECLKRLMKERCVQTLKEIRNILDDDTLEDPECFRRIERIVEVYEALGADAGSRHDF